MKRTLVLDIECYPNYFLVQFKSLDTKRVQSFELYEGQSLDRAAIIGIMRQFLIVTFNGCDYDLPMAAYALRENVDNAMLKAASDAIIEGNLRGWQFEQAYGVRADGVDHIDLREPVPGVQISLKQYGGRIHSKRLQDLPYPPDQPLTRAQMAEVKAYCENDLDTTIDLWNKARDPKDDIIGTRIALTAEYGIDVRSKSDAQCAEAIIRHEVEKLKGERVWRQEVPPGTTYKYNAPAFIEFRSQVLRDMFADVCAANFVVQRDGKIAMPKTLEGRTIKLGSSVYRMGIGGLHSSEKSQAVIGTRDVLVRDRDVASFYPFLILQCGLAPENMGQHFQRVYRSFRDRRIDAKRTGNKSVAQTLKIFLNGTFGKLGSRWSVLYAPNLLIQVTLTGQLVLLMLIERMELAGIPVVSANTDGIVMACPAHLEATMHRVVAEWERATGAETEETRYRALFSRDVNNYVALKDGGGTKTKGVFSDPGFMKNPQNVIVNEAVCAFLDTGAPIAETILRCRDIRKFLTVKRVTGGAVFRRTYLGKVVRWYRSAASLDAIHYGPGKKEGHKVGGSDNAMPLMELPDTFPVDIDYGFYIAEAFDSLRDIGAIK